MPFHQLRHRQLRDDDDERVDRPDDADPLRADARLVLRERRQQLHPDRHARRDHERVEADVAHEDAVADDVSVTARRALGMQRGGGQAQQHSHVPEERGRVEHEEGRVAPSSDDPADQTAERDAQVHRQALQRER